VRGRISRFLIPAGSASSPAALTLLFLLPIIWMVTTSFQAGEKMFQLTTEWIPTVWHPENYPTRWAARSSLYFWNSFVVRAW
jgi:multiple sugar transport system permease protein